jgi:hypothetical protein
LQDGLHPCKERWLLFCRRPSVTQRGGSPSAAASDRAEISALYHAEMGLRVWKAGCNDFLIVAIAECATVGGGWQAALLWPIMVNASGLE